MTAAPGPEPRRGALRRILTGPVGQIALPLAVVVVVFAGVLPRIADYSTAWRLVWAMTWSDTVLLLGVAGVNLLSYALVWTSAMPGLGWWRAFRVEQASTAVANTVPVGFAFGVGTIAAMYTSFGFPPSAITRSIALSGIWNNLVKLAMPVVALLGLALTGDATRALAVAAGFGSAVLTVAVTVLVLVLVHAEAATAVSGAAQRLAAAVCGWLRRPRPSGWVETTDRFRQDSLEVLRHRWGRLTAATVFSHTALFAVLLTSLHAVDGPGPPVPWLDVLAVFSITRLVTIVPITPGALGVAELSYVAGLVAVGVPPATAAATVLVFRALTWLLPIPVGAVVLLTWRRGAGRRHTTSQPAGT